MRATCASGSRYVMTSPACCAPRPSRSWPRSMELPSAAVSRWRCIAASDVKLGQPEIRIAFIPPIATTQALARLIGRPRAIRYLYEGRLLGAAEALAWGLVDEIAEPGDLRHCVQRYAEDLAAKPAAALAAIRRTITLGGGVSFEDGMALELETATALADTPDFAEGVDAFLNKRAPRWAGS